MDRCSPVIMRENLVIVEKLKLVGMDFVAIPVRNAKHKAELVALAKMTLDEIITDID